MRSLLLLAGLSFASVDAQAAILTVDCTVGPYFTINSAVGAANNGDTIVVHPCTYNENVVISGFDDLHIIAARRAAGAANVTGAVPVGVGVVPTIATIVDGTGLPGAGFLVQQSRDVTISGFWVRRCATNGIDVRSSQAVVVVNNRLERNTFAGYFEAQSNEGRVAGNYVIRNGSFGVYLEQTATLTVEDNRVTSSGRNGIFVAGDRIELVNNDVSFSGAEGIQIGFGNENRVERNTTLSNNTAGGGFPNLGIQAGANLTDAVGNHTAGSFINLGVGTDLGDNS